MKKSNVISKMNKQGFTLAELLTVVAILAVLLLIAVPTSLYIQNKSKKQSFFMNVSNIVNTIKPNQLLEEKDMCIYNYEADEKNNVKNIKSMYVLAHKDGNKTINSVYALMDDEQTVIDIYDFSKLNINDFSDWQAIYNKEGSYTYYAGKLIYDSNKLDETLSYKICNIG